MLKYEAIVPKLTFLAPLPLSTTKTSLKDNETSSINDVNSLFSLLKSKLEISVLIPLTTAFVS